MKQILTQEELDALSPDQLEAPRYTLTIFIPGIPKAQPRARAFAFRGKARMYTPGTAEAWKGAIAAALTPHLPPRPIENPVQVTIEHYFQRPKNHYYTGRRSNVLRTDAPHYHVSKPDRDNLEKAFLDTCTQIGLWKDDSQVCDGPIRKVYSDDGRTGARVTIEEL